MPADDHRASSCYYYTDQTRQALREAGWRSVRAIDIAGWEAELTADGFPSLHPAARRFLAEYGGLRLPYSGPGVTRAREGIELTPEACSGEADRFIEWSEDLQRQIAPIGELAPLTCSSAFLGMDERGEIYVVETRLRTFGRMPSAMDRLVLGHMPEEVTDGAGG